MQSEDRVIHFSLELVHPPSPLKKEALQKLYFELSQTRHGSYDNTDFTNMLTPKFSSRRGQRTQSVAVFLPDRLLLIEEWADIPLSDFIDKVQDIAPLALEAREAKECLAHSATVRSTFALSHFEDARTFLIDHACKQDQLISPHFQRPIAVGGLRFVLPETNDHPGNFNVTIESFRHSRSEVFVEVKGVFGRQRTPVDDLSVVTDNLRAVRNFVSERVYPYLNQFDQPLDGLE